MNSPDVEFFMTLAREIGVKSLLGQFFIIIVLIVLFKKYIFKGMATGIKAMWKGWLASEQDRIRAQSDIAHAMTEERASTKELRESLHGQHDATVALLQKSAEALAQVIHLLQSQEREQVEHTLNMRGHMEEQLGLKATLDEVQRGVIESKQSIERVLVFYSDVR